MLVKVTFAVILVATVTAVVTDKLSLTQSQAEYDIFEQKDIAAGVCCPQIILKPPGSSLYALPGYQAHVEVIPDYGNCTGTTYKYFCYVYWGDGSCDSRGFFNGVVENCAMDHKYSSDNETYYTVEAQYCNIYSDRPNPGQTCCSNLSKDIFITK